MSDKVKFWILLVLFGCSLVLLWYLNHTSTELFLTQ